MSSLFTQHKSGSKLRHGHSHSTADAKIIRKRNGITKVKGNTNSNPKRNGNISLKKYELDDESIASDDASQASLSSNESQDLESDDGETAADHRRKLASRYVDRLRDSTYNDFTHTYDTSDDFIALRLRNDVAASHGRMYKFIAHRLSLERINRPIFFRCTKSAVYAITGHQNFIITGHKDGTLALWTVNDNIPVSSKNRTQRLRPVLSAFSCDWRRQSHRKHPLPGQIAHSGAILSCAISPCGSLIATGGLDGKIIIWLSQPLTPISQLTQHRSSVTGLIFKQPNRDSMNSTNVKSTFETLYSCSADRSVKVWAVSRDSSSYVESLFGHQDIIMNIDALNTERCITVGARDRTARYWKIPEQCQLVFNGGGLTKNASHTSIKSSNYTYSEGSLDCIACLDNETFVTGSDTGTISLWRINQKKPIFTCSMVHGFNPGLRQEEITLGVSSTHQTNIHVPKNPRGITALAALPFSDFFVSGSWDGYIRGWKVEPDKKSFRSLGCLARHDRTNNINESNATNKYHGYFIHGVINDLHLYQANENDANGLIYCIAGIGSEHRLYKRITINSTQLQGKNGSLIFRFQPTKAQSTHDVI